MPGPTKQELQTLYHPLTYKVWRVNKCVYTLRHEYTDQLFYAKQDNSGWTVLGPSGNRYQINSSCECSCPDYLRALKQDRFCKHQAVVLAVAEFIKYEKKQYSPDETRKEIKEMFK